MLPLIFWFRYFIFRIGLWLSKTVKRFESNYDYHSKDPCKYGLFYPEQEYIWEKPSKDISQNDDIVGFFLQQSAGSSLFLRLQRTREGVVSVCLRLACTKGSYILNDILVDTSTEDTFACGGLKVEVVIAMRRWRIIYNGLMTNTSTNQKEHVRFVFTGNYITGCGDYQSSYDPCFLSKQLASSNMPLSSAWPGTIDKYLQDIDMYVQSFTSTGKVFIGEDAVGEELYLWGYRTRGRQRDVSHIRNTGRITLYTENGLGVDLNQFEMKGVFDNLFAGVLLYPSIQEREIENLTLDSFSNLTSFRVGADKFKDLEVIFLEKVGVMSPIIKNNGQWHQMDVKVYKILYDGNMGYAVVYGEEGKNLAEDLNLPTIPPYISQYGKESQTWKKCDRNVLSFNEEFCTQVELTGGKGSSLAVLTKISGDSNKADSFTVPQGICVTTIAYRKFTKIPQVQQAIADLLVVCKSVPDSKTLEDMCKQTQESIGDCELPPDVRQDIIRSLDSIFGKDWSTSNKFAVRSSGCGEDSDEMSAAGQNETILGVIGADNIFSAVAKCWASQFSFVAVQYKRRYGQLVDSDMCVVIQEMVNSDVSGVMFTVDPVTSSPLKLTITANFGLGESVVSASADPDTFLVDRSNISSSGIHMQLGKKNMSTIMLENGGTKDIESSNSRSHEQSLTEKQILHLASVGVHLERCYASPRDTEWAFHKGRLYMLQARPVTSTFNIDNDFEYRHESDQGYTSEFECFSKANVGEVMGGSVSPFTKEVVMSTAVSVKLDAIKRGADYGRSPFSRYELMVQLNAQMFLATYSSFADMTGDDIISKGFSVALAGRLVRDEIAVRSNENKKKYLCRGGNMPGMIELIKTLWTAEETLLEGEEAVRAYKSDLSSCKSTFDYLIIGLDEPQNKGLWQKSGNGHMKVITYGTINNAILLALLSSSEGDWNSNVFSDFGHLVSACNDVVSAGVPQSLQKLTQVISNQFGNAIRDMSPEDALGKLRNDPGESGQLFRQFLKTHGHRSLHEFDYATKTWEIDPLPVIKTLQSMLGEGVKTLAEGGAEDLDEIISKMQIKMSFPKKILMKFILKRVRHGIAMRERTKSALVYANHMIRKNIRLLADIMVEEGRLDDPDLIYFLIPNEIKTLIETRSPKLIMKAMLRKRAARKAEKDIYEETAAGFPLVPINERKFEIPMGTRQMKGTPVSKGSIVATARVVVNLEDAHEIEKGDVLITYATDIGWSPYFPLLSGIVTELGGLISHGAVVAREYGLPCIVGMHGATKLFKSGDKVLLDGTQGILCTVDE